MLISRKLLAATVAVLCAAPAVAPIAASVDTASSIEIPADEAGVYIVTLASPALPEKLANEGIEGKVDLAKRGNADYLAKLAAEQDDTLAKASAVLGRKLAPHFRYKLALNGYAVKLGAGEAALLRALPGVVAVERERIDRLMTDSGPQFVGAEPLWNGTIQGSNARTKGEGVVVGVIDSGINPTHPSFADVGGDGHNHANPRGRTYGACAGRCNDKLIGIYDYTNEGARDGRDLDGHGTHVAGTAVGNAIDSGINANTGSIALRVSGVAPHANLISYKACVLGGEGEATSCPNSATLAAIEQAIADQIDVVNYSIGGDPRDPWTGVRNGARDDASAMLNARFAGVAVVVAAGNDGPGEGTVSSPSVAPWVLSVANVTHDRRFANAVEITGGARFEGLSLNGQRVTARIVDAADYGFPLCSKGDAIDSPPTGASNPFAPNTFNGEIVLCRRGITARVAKGFNVKAAGAAGMILYNSPAEGEAVVADDHFLPATHVGRSAGDQLVALVRAARESGGEVRGTITATTIARSGGGVLSPDSGRGPTKPIEGYLKPNLAAPGSSILAADHDSNGLAIKSGTSMASPHVAGAAALIASAKPAWSVAQIESALMTTAKPTLVKDDGVTRASALDVGAGLIDVSAAVRAGLWFDVTRNDFVNADPQAGGNLPNARQPGALNLPSLAGRCNPRCTFSRTVTANGASTWTADVQAPAGVRVTVDPPSFTLSAGASRSFTVSVEVLAAPAVGRWNDARLTWTPSDNALAPTALPIAVFGESGALAGFALTPSSTSGRFDTTLAGLPPLANARFHATRLVQPTTRLLSIARDATASDPYDDGKDVAFVDLALPADATRGALFVDLASPNATTTDIDLYVGLDRDDDGVAEASEVVCAGRSSDGIERCVASFARGAARRAWVLSHVFSSPNVTSNSFAIETALVPQSELAPLDAVATMPGRTDGAAAVPLRISYSKPDAVPQRRYVGVLSMSQGSDVLLDLPLELTPANAIPTPLVLVPDRALELALPANTAHERLVIDVPQGATALTIEQSGSGDVDLYVARADAGVTTIGTAPARGLAQGTSIRAGAAERVDLTAPTLTAGRWYVTPVNVGASVASISLRASFAGATTATLADNGYFNPQRSGHGTFFHKIGPLWAVVWYTYLEDRTPAWYIATGAAPANGKGAWTAPLLRFTWDGARAVSTPVGEATITTLADDRYGYAWRLDGEYGAEPMQPTGAIACAAVTGSPLSVAGSWYAPSASGYGFNVVTSADAEALTAYLYDAAGNPRWVLGASSTPGRGTIPLTQYRGFCPTCAFEPITGTAVGTLTRAYQSATAATSAVDVTWSAPLAGRWQTSAALEKLTATTSCP